MIGWSLFFLACVLFSALFGFTGAGAMFSGLFRLSFYLFSIALVALMVLSLFVYSPKSTNSPKAQHAVEKTVAPMRMIYAP